MYWTDKVVTLISLVNTCLSLLFNITAVFLKNFWGFSITVAEIFQDVVDQIFYFFHFAHLYELCFKRKNIHNSLFLILFFEKTVFFSFTPKF